MNSQDYCLRTLILRDFNDFIRLGFYLLNLVLKSRFERSLILPHNSMPDRNFQRCGIRKEERNPSSFFEEDV